MVQNKKNIEQTRGLWEKWVTETEAEWRKYDVELAADPELGCICSQRYRKEETASGKDRWREREGWWSTERAREIERGLWCIVWCLPCTGQRRPSLARSDHRKTDVQANRQQRTSDPSMCVCVCVCVRSCTDRCTDSRSYRRKSCYCTIGSLN